MSRLERGERRHPQKDDLLSSVLQRARGRQIRARKTQNRYDYDDVESDDFPEKSDDEDQTMHLEQSENR